MHTFAERLLDAMKEAGITQARLAERVGLTRASINGWASGATKEPHPDHVAAAAEALRVWPKWLRTGQGQRHMPPEVRSGQAAYRSARPLPLISWTRAGSWAEIEDPFPPGAADDWIHVPGLHSQHAFALRVVGDSMEPAIAAGSIVVIDPEREARHGSIVLAKQVNEQTSTLKRLWYDGGAPCLKPENPRYPIIAVTADTRIIGVATIVYQEL